MKKSFIAIICVLCLIAVSFGFTSCASEEQYVLTVSGSEYLYEKLHETYKAGEEVKVKTKIVPYKGTKVMLDTELLTKAKSDQDDYLMFTLEMPAHDATLAITSFNGFDEPLLYGYHITFSDHNGPIENLSKPVESEDAITYYVAPNYNDNGTDMGYSPTIGANVFVDSKMKIEGNNFELESTLFFTYELLGTVMSFDLVYYNIDTQKVFVDASGGGQVLNDLGTLSVSHTQNLSDTRHDNQMKEYTEKFDSFVKLNVEYIDYLTGVKVLEYSANGELIKSTDIAKFDSEKEHITSENCEYVIVEEEYTVKNDEKRNGETYSVRTLIYKSKSSDGKLLKYPRGDGLISPAYLSVKWQDKI